MIPPWQYGGWFLWQQHQKRRSKMTPAEKASDDEAGCFGGVIVIVIVGIIFLFKK